MWGPDGMQVVVPVIYDATKLIAGLRACLYCDAQDVPTQRVSFAGRCCATCFSEQKRIQEYPGWTN